MPSIRLNKAFKVAKDIKAYFHLEGGFTRGVVPDPKKQIEDQANKLRNARKRISKQRQAIRVKDREIERLEKLSASNTSNASKASDAPAKGKQAPQKNPRRISKPGDGSLPEFLILGAQKSGTSSLYSFLKDHPQVAPASKKEVHYFDSPAFRRGEGWYRSNFPAPSSTNGHKIITGEASPYYLYHPLVPKRAAHLLPNARLIALLRNPVDRAYSDYNHRLSDGIETLSFEEAIEAEEERIKGEKEKMLTQEGYFSPNHRRYSYLARGIYVDQLEDWHEHFGRDQLLVIKSEDFFSRTGKVMQQVLDFLELPAWEEKKSFGQGTNRRSYDKMSPQTRSKLEKYFEPHNQRLYEYLDTDFGW